MYSFDCILLYSIYCSTTRLKIKNKNSSGNWLQTSLKSWGYMYICSSSIYCTYIRTSWKKGTSMGQEDVQKNGWQKESQMKVRWLLTNRKHGRKTKSVSVLKAALINGGMRKKQKSWLLMIDRTERTEKNWLNYSDRKRVKTVVAFYITQHETCCYLTILCCNISC